MDKPRVSSTLVSIAFLFMAACHSQDRTAKDALGTPVDERQRTLAVDAVDGLRDAFNSGSCQSIYDLAAAHFRTQSLEEWISQCRELNENLGSWQTFSASSAQKCGGGPSAVILCVRGSARFAKGIKEVDVAWLLDNGRAKLMWISLRRSQGTWVQIPPWRGPGQLWDPPPPTLPAGC
jgi:hypothetical protein